MAKKKGKDKDKSGSRDSEAVLGALGLSLPDMSSGKSKPASAVPAAAPESDLTLSFDLGAPAPAPARGKKPIAAPAPVPLESAEQPGANFSQDNLMLSFGAEAPTPARGKPSKPGGSRQAVPLPQKPQARPKPAAAPRKLAALPELPQFVKPEDIMEIQGFDAPPTEGKGKITEIIWNLKATDQASNVISRQKRALSPLMAEALDQVQMLRDTIKQQKKGAPAASAPAKRPAPKPAAKPQPAPKAAAKPAPKPQQRPAVRPVALPEPLPEPAPEPVEEPSLPEIGEEPQAPVQPAARPSSQARPAGRPRLQPTSEPEMVVPERDIIKTPVKSRLGDEVMTAQTPIEKSHWDEAKSVMAPMATTKFTAVSKQNFDAAPSPVVQPVSPRPGAARAARVPVPVIEEAPSQEMEEAQAPAKTTGKDQMLPGGGKICGKCGGSNFREDNDKSKPLSFTPPFLYAKKYTCKSCGHVFNLGGDGAAESQIAQAAPRPTRPSQVAAARQPTAAASASRKAPTRHVQTTWEDTKPESVRPSDVLAKKGIRQEPLPSKVAAQEYEPAEEQAPTPEQKEVGRMVCPNCGGTSFNLIQDKTRPISYGMGGIGATYAKVHQCKKCGTKVD